MSFWHQRPKCTPLNSGGTLPQPFSNTPTVELSNTVQLYYDKDILKIIRALHVNKIHGCDAILIQVIKMCDQLIVKPLCLWFIGTVLMALLPDIWKKLIKWNIFWNDNM